MTNVENGEGANLPDERQVCGLVMPISGFQSYTSMH